jgi:hypothetical protein
MTNAQWNRFKNRKENNRNYWDAFLGFLVLSIVTASFMWILSAMTWVIK